MKQCKKITKLSAVSLLFLSILSQPLWASFDVTTDEEEYPTYGRARNKVFDDTVEGSISVSQEDRTFLEELENKRTVYRGYIRGLIGKPSVKLKNFENTSTGTVMGAQFAESEKSENVLNFLLAAGYNWQRWAFEFEVLFSESLKWSENPFIAGFNFEGVTSLAQYAAFVNGRYNFPFLMPERLFLFFLAGLGLSYNSTDTDTYGTVGVAPNTSRQAMDTNSASKTNLAYQLGFGISFQAAPKLFLELGYRIMDLGKAEYGPVQNVTVPATQVTIEAKDIRSSGIFLGAAYQIG
jgi:opacity protein-like surface antigen